MVETFPEEAQERRAWRRFFWIAGTLSLVFHLGLWWAFWQFQLGFGPPLVNPVDPPRFNVRPAEFDPRVLEPGGSITPGVSTPPTQRPIELDPDRIAAFGGPLQAPRIPTPRLTAEDPSPLSAGGALVREAASALPVAELAKIPVVSGAALGEAASAALPEAIAAISTTNLLGGPPGEGGALGSGVPGFGDFAALIESPPPDQLPVERPPFQPILIRLSSDVLFAFDSAELLPSAEQPLRELAAALNRVIRATVTIEGHTDTFGDDAYNLRLSRERAGAVAQWLRQHAELPPDSYRVQGFGRSRPIVNPQGTKEEQARNRRVEIRIEAER